MTYPSEVDIVIIGAGASGVTLLNRLARNNPTVSFLVIERGPIPINDPTVIAPCAALMHLVPGAKYTKFTPGEAGERKIMVTAVIEDGRATAVEFEGGIVRARRTVVVSSGTLGSPHILERSGIGSKTVLEKAGVTVKIENEDHSGKLLTSIVQLLIILTLVVPVSYRGGDGLVLGQDILGLQEGGVYNSNMGIQVGAKVHMSPTEVQKTSRQHQEFWKKVLEPFPDRAIAWIGLFTRYLGDANAVGGGTLFTTGATVNHLSVSGSIHISGASIKSPPVLMTGTFEHPHDLEAHVWAYKKHREITRRLQCYRGELTVGHPNFAKDSPAAVQEHADGPVPIDASPLEYSPKDDDAIRDYVTKVVSNTGHHGGTCSMGTVLDHQLNVIGCQNLKVCDMSIIPSRIGGNTFATACVIGEKGALIIAEGVHDILTSNRFKAH
ncbi:GMC oxidoreductase [Atractiella rhizophila]|nr:GMC oxidoreductase [Atractiella rhizophila]